MPKSENQKLKLLTLFKILNEQTDEDHPMTVQDMILELQRYDIAAERKSIYDDLESLRRFGVDIVVSKSKSTSYFVASRTFEVAELKLLADAVASSKFITEKKSHQLIKKIETLASIHEAGRLQRQVYVQGRVKTMNENIYYNVDAVQNAISQSCKISFQYFEYTVDKNKRLRHGGEKYIVSPYALSWDDENYYMIAHHPKYDSLSHFRVDKMTGIEQLSEKRTPVPDFNPSEYTKKMFNMFSGEEQKIGLQLDNSLIDVVIDRFGKDVIVYKNDETTFIAHITACVSPTFLAWLFEFGDRIRVVSPQSVIDSLRDKAERCLSAYEN